MKIVFFPKYMKFSVMSDMGKWENYLFLGFIMLYWAVFEHFSELRKVFLEWYLLYIYIYIYIYIYRKHTCNGYCDGKWTWWPEFKSWTRVFAFLIARIPLGRVWTWLFFPQLVWPSQLRLQNTLTAYLQRGRTPPISVLDMTLNNLIVRLH